MTIDASHYKSLRQKIEDIRHESCRLAYEFGERNETCTVRADEAVRILSMISELGQVLREIMNQVGAE
jgi:hypothetical protein